MDRLEAFFTSTMNVMAAMMIMINVYCSIRFSTDVQQPCQREGRSQMEVTKQTILDRHLQGVHAVDWQERIACLEWLHIMSAPQQHLYNWIKIWVKRFASLIKIVHCSSYSNGEMKPDR